MLVIIFFLVSFFLAIAIQTVNKTPIDLNIFGFVLQDVPLSFLLMLFFTMGVILALLLLRVDLLLQNNKIKKMEEELLASRLENKKLKEEIENRDNMR